jgi:phage protein|nr:MAG TPA: hypothetical protein [Caudoviricetes sp.]DAU88233.1 MAG TPA: hypothetical protein [Caudoviricetes sp.]
MINYATIDDITALFRPLKPDEIEKAKALLPIVSDSLRVEAKNSGKNLDIMVKESVSYANVVKSVTVDIVARTLMTSTDSEPMTQTSETALGYTFQGTYLVPGGGLFIKKTELARLGLKKQRFGVIELYGQD